MGLFSVQKYASWQEPFSYLFILVVFHNIPIDFYVSVFYGPSASPPVINLIPPTRGRNTRGLTWCRTLLHAFCRSWRSFGWIWGVFFSPSWGNDDSQFWWAYFLNWVAETNQNSPLGRHVSMEKTSMKQWMILIHTFAHSFHLIWNKSKENPWLFCGETKILSNPTDVVVNIKKHGCEKKRNGCETMVACSSNLQAKLGNLRTSPRLETPKTVFKYTPWELTYHTLGNGKIIIFKRCR